MNAAARALAESSFTVENIRDMLISPRNLFFTLLIFAVLLTACGVIYIKDLNRRLFYDSQLLQQAHDELQLQGGQLLLEQNTWATQGRIQQIAHDDLTMDIPSSQIVVAAD